MTSAARESNFVTKGPQLREHRFDRLGRKTLECRRAKDVCVVLHILSRSDKHHRLAPTSNDATRRAHASAAIIDRYRVTACTVRDCSVQRNAAGYCFHLHQCQWNSK